MKKGNCPKKLCRKSNDCSIDVIYILQKGEKHFCPQEKENRDFIELKKYKNLRLTVFGDQSTLKFVSFIYLHCPPYIVFNLSSIMEI